MVRHLISALVVLAAGSLLIASRGSADAPSDAARTPASVSAPSTTPSSAGASAASRPKGSTLPEILPPGKGLTLLLDNCSSCHSVVCAVKGQRPVDRWESLKNDHKDKVTSLSEADLNTLFSYLAENFNNAKPEPKLPPELAQQGSCTPF